MESLTNAFPLLPECLCWGCGARDKLIKVIAQAFPGSPPPSCLPALAMGLCVAPARPASGTQDWAPSWSNTEDHGLWPHLGCGGGPRDPIPSFRGTNLCCCACSSLLASAKDKCFTWDFFGFLENALENVPFLVFQLVGLPGRKIPHMHLHKAGALFHSAGVGRGPCATIRG